MTKAMPFLQKAILLSYDPRRFGGVPEFIKKGHSPFLIKGLQSAGGKLCEASIACQSFLG